MFRIPGLRPGAGVLAMPAVVVLVCFFVAPLWYVAEFSLGLRTFAPNPAAALTNGELTELSIDLFRALLRGDVALHAFGVVVSAPVGVAAVLALALLLVARLGPRLGTWGRVARPVALVLLIVPFFWLPIGGTAIRVAHLSAPNSQYLDLFLQSVSIAATTSIVAVLLAFPIAYFLSMCAGRRRYTLLLLVVAPFLTSYLLRILGWKIILGDEGVIVSGLQGLGILDGGQSVSWLLFSPFAVEVVLLYAWVPFVVLPIFLALEGLDARLLESAADLRASRWTAFRRVTLPLAAPGIAAGFLFVFIPTIGEFVAPLFVGGTDGYMYGNAISGLFGGSLDWQTGSALAIFLLAVVLVVTSLAGGLLRGPADETGRGRVRATPALAASRTGRTALGVFFVAFLAFLYLPTLTLVLFSLNDSATPAFPFQGLTLRWFSAAWDDANLRAAIANSALVALGTATAATALGAAAAYGLARTTSRARSVITGFVLLPLVVPYVVLGAALLILFQRGPIPFGQSLWAVLFGHVVLTLPFAVLILLPAMARIDRRVVESARDLGASTTYLARRVILPLIAPALGASFLLCFVISLDEYPVASFLVGSDTTYPVYLFSQLRFPARLPLVLAVATVMIALSLALVLAAEVLRRRGERRVAPTADALAGADADA